MIHKALELSGGVSYLVRQAEENPVAFMNLLAKVIPKQVDIGGQPDNPIVTTIRIIGVEPRSIIEGESASSAD